MNLGECKSGKEYIILRIDLKENNKKRLFDLGLTEGVNVKLIRTAPLNSPIQIMFRNFSLILRKKDAEKIMVKEK